MQQSGRVQPVTKVQSQTDTSQSSLNLKVTTAEGDTVELSFNISDLAQLQQAHVQNGQGSADAVSATQSHSESFSAKVNGNLSDQELKDIQSLLQYLQTGKPSDQALSSLSGYSGEFSQTQSHSESTFVQYA